MRKVVFELCRSFKEIFLVAVLLITLIYVFAAWGVFLFGMRDRRVTLLHFVTLMGNMMIKNP